MPTNFLDIISQRHCKRAFLDTPVSQDALRRILAISGHAGSSKNTQPWQVCVLTGQTLEDLKMIMCKKCDADDFDSPDYAYMIDPMPDVFKARARDCGYRLFDLKGIARDDHEARKAHFRENYTFFEAPVAFIFHLDRQAERGNFLDMGLFMQNVMLGLVAEGLGSCPQFSIARFSDTIRQHLGLSEDRLIVCGMSVGVPDPDAEVNTFIPPREPVDNYTQWFD